MDRRQQEHLIESIIRSLGTSLRNRGLYPPSHPLVRKPIEKCFSDLVPLFGDRKDLALLITDGTLVFEGVPLFSLTSSLELFMERLGRIGVPAIILERDLTVRDLDSFIRFLHEEKGAGLPVDEIQRRLEAEGIRHIRVKEAKDEEEDDLSLAREIYDNATALVASVLKDVRLGRIPSGGEVSQVVRDIGGMLKKNRDAMLALTLIKNFDEYTYTHSVNVAVISLALADVLSFSEQDKVDVGVAGLLHDVGKTQLALALIRKAGGLTVEEFEEIKKHPEEGFALLGKMADIRPDSAYMVLEHHMRFDRTGYPRPGPEHRRHRYSHIIPVADCYDALTTMRTYQKARSPLQALEVMEKIGGKSLDPDLVRTLRGILGVYPAGTMVRLSTMEVGLVTAAGMPGERPARVAVLFDGNGTPLPQPEQVDVMEGVGPTEKRRRTILGTVNPLYFPHTAAAAVLTPVSGP
jgi:putative nucleotidyltransferase with HDIG domain